MVSSSDRLRVPFLPSFFSNLTRFTEFYRVYRVLLSFFLPNIGLISDSSPTSFFYRVLPSRTEHDRTVSPVLFFARPLTTFATKTKHWRTWRSKSMADIVGRRPESKAVVVPRRWARLSLRLLIGWNGERVCPFQPRRNVPFPHRTIRDLTNSKGWGGRPSPGTGTRLGPFLERPMGWRRGGGSAPFIRRHTWRQMNWTLKKRTTTAVSNKTGSHPTRI